MPQNEHLIWYEANLPAQERKIRGHFSTPPLLVNQILDACGYTADANLTRLRVLDPACGSGNFLAGAAQRLLTRGVQHGERPQQTLATLQRNLWGFDPDPVACFLADMQVRALCTAHVAPPHKNFAHQRLHIHQADGLTFPWEQARRESVDLFLANPPYLAAKNADLSAYRSTQGLGQADSYLLFLQLALQVVRPDGWLGLVLPDPMLARANAARERQRLLAETTVHQLWHLSHVFPAYVGAVVIIAQKRPPRRFHQVLCVREKWERRRPVRVMLPTLSVAQTLMHAQPGAELRYLLGNEHETLVERLYLYMARGVESLTLAPLYRFVTIRRGEELGKKSVLLASVIPHEEGWHPLLRGGVDVRPYGTPRGQCWLAERAIEKPLARYHAPKLLVVKSTSTLQAALDLHGHVVLQTLYLLTLHLEKNTLRPPLDTLDTFYFLLALLNSRLLKRYVYVLHTAYKLVQPQIEQHVLARLPVPLVMPAMQQEIAERAKQIMLACSAAPPVVELSQQLTALCEEQERAICALYENAIRV